MIASLAAIVALVSPAPSALSPYDIVGRAQTAWEARFVPAYVSFTIPCADTFLDARCEPKAIVNFVVRMDDGRTYAEATDVPGTPLMCGGFIYGPASTPFGFFRRIGSDNVPASLATPPPPENFAADPFGPKAIASVTVTDRAYTVTLTGIENLDGATVYHVHLEPNYAPDAHPLRDLWIDTTTFEVLQLTYARHAESGAPAGTVRYRFAQVGSNRIWAIVYIDATLPVKGSRTAANPHSDLADITFPKEEPAWRFTLGCGGE
ncbi:MAG TPA: hypothetical protein VK760_03880 [Candidatus Acidoferrales bacterium]|jgi:hypothetical protein|nr:hypothetical protein [Candidatus Acidoferrales bacterium]